MRKRTFLIEVLKHIFTIHLDLWTLFGKSVADMIISTLCHQFQSVFVKSINFQNTFI